MACFDIVGYHTHTQPRTSDTKSARQWCHTVCYQPHHPSIQLVRDAYQIFTLRGIIITIIFWQIYISLHCCSLSASYSTQHKILRSGNITLTNAWYFQHKYFNSILLLLLEQNCDGFFPFGGPCLLLVWLTSPPAVSFLDIKKQ